MAAGSSEITNDYQTIKEKQNECKAKCEKIKNLQIQTKGVYSPLPRCLGKPKNSQPLSKRPDQDGYSSLVGVLDNSTFKIFQ